MNISLSRILNKKLIISVITSSAFITGLTLAVIWLYLSNIDRLDIFHDTANVKSIMGMILGFAVLSVLIFSIFLFAPSFVLIVIYTIYEENLKKYDGIAHSFTTVGMFNNLVLCLLSIICLSIYIYSGLDGVITLLLFLFILIVSSFVMTNKKILKSPKYLSQDSSEEDSFLKKKVTIILLPLLLLIPAIAQITPLSFLFNQLEFTKNSKDIAQIGSITALALMFAILSILPGIIYINENKNGKLVRSIILALIFTPTTLVILSLIFHPIPNMIINMTMNLSGISDWRAHNFYIDNKTHPHTMFNGLEWNTRRYQNIPNRFFITGVNIFTLGDTKLICPTKIINARKESLKMTPNDSNEQNRKANKLKSVAMECIPLSKNDIHTWDSPISEPIYYEKVKVASDSLMLKILDPLK